MTTKFHLYCPEVEVFSALLSWLEDNTKTHTVVEQNASGQDQWQTTTTKWGRVWAVISFTDDVEAAHFKLRFCEELDRKPTGIDAAIFYCPYVPLTYSGKIVDASTMIPLNGFVTRYGVTK